MSVNQINGQNSTFVQLVVPFHTANIVLTIMKFVILDTFYVNMLVDFLLYLCP